MVAERISLGNQILNILKEKGPMTTVDTLIHVSGTRPEVAREMKILEAKGFVKKIVIPGRVYSGWEVVR